MTRLLPRLHLRRKPADSVRLDPHDQPLLAGLAVIDTSITDYYVKRPKLAYPVFLFFYILEHLAYQAGVFIGCLKQGYFGSYRLSFNRI